MSDRLLERGAALVRDWFGSLGAAAEAGRPAAYVFVMGSLTELLRAFELPVVFPEINSLQTAVRRVAHEYLDEAEDYGYSPDICAYVKADVGLQLRGGRHPMGVVPRPALAVLTNACNTYIKWAEIWERMYGTEVFVVDIPGTRQEGRAGEPGDAEFERDRSYVAAQLRDLIGVCERLTGRPLDLDGLRARMGDANRLSGAYRRVLALNRARPAPFNAVTDGTVYLGVANALRGTPQAANYFVDLAADLEERVVRGAGTPHAEKFRLAFAGVPCYPIFRRFNEMFAAWGGAFVTSTYLWFASGGAALGWQYRLEDDLVESLAEGLLVSTSRAMDSMFFADLALDALVDDFEVDGIVFHAVKSCRTVSTGLADARRALVERRGIPTLLLEADMMDRRVVSEAQLQNRIDAFFEGLSCRTPRA